MIVFLLLTYSNVDRHGSEAVERIAKRTLAERKQVPPGLSTGDQQPVNNVSVGLARGHRVAIRGIKIAQQNGPFGGVPRRGVASPLPQ
jgi:hypothetical protein